MKNFTSFFSLKSFIQFIVYSFAGIFLCLGSLHSQTIDKTKPVGTIDGSANSTGSGGATYTIPIEVPFGTNGMQPNLSLVYNSQSADGIAGIGWSLNAYSVISRASKNYFHDGIAKPVNYTNSNDAFQLDGQRLFAITGNNGADAAVYGTEAETFSKIESFGGTETSGPDWFKVTAKNGTIMEFGHATNTKVLTDNGQNTALWLLNKVIDKNGNYSVFIYSIDNIGRNYALADIYYTGNESQGLLPYNTVHLSYTVRNTSQTNRTYDGGASMTTPYNLDKITITNEAGTIVKTYQCAYNIVKNEYFLSSVQEAGSDGTTLNPTVFTYGANTVTDDVTISALFEGNFLPSDDTYAGDFNGDGKQDVLAARYYYDNNGFKHHTGYQVMGDFMSYGTTPGLSLYLGIDALDGGEFNLGDDIVRSGKNAIISASVDAAGTWADELYQRKADQASRRSDATTVPPDQSQYNSPGVITSSLPGNPMQMNVPVSPNYQKNINTIQRLKGRTLRTPNRLPEATFYRSKLQ